MRLGVQYTSTLPCPDRLSVTDSHCAIVGVQDTRHCPLQTDCPSQTATALLSDFPGPSVVDQRTKLLFVRKTSLKLLSQTVLKQQQTKTCAEMLEKKPYIDSLDIVADQGAVAVTVR